jgi:hypothetical protein
MVREQNFLGMDYKPLSSLKGVWAAVGSPYCIILATNIYIKSTPNLVNRALN